ncbi:cellulose biosynthesis protein BcsD [uncultured Xanthomonas sp.]|uniref:cellulose biosynthesis protein BcsD n=1 Tax=uncultured Xanthomonas sp. TaxID=152831 RepID=UPI0025DE32DD|nr:cellulose biosynthesis protein BcsD [uncultured Xanthomonas sp.]
MSAHALQTHYRTHACSRQWRGFLRALAEEFAAELGAEDLALLMARIGRRFAAEHTVGACTTLQELEDAVNRVWDRLEWGYARFEEHADRVELLHAGSPLHIGLAGQAGGADGFLEGVYQAWFVQVGMSAGLGVRALSSGHEDLRRFVLARAG